MKKVILSSLITLFISPAFAGQLNGACKQDVQRLCAGIEKGNGRIKSCMQSKRSQLSQNCKSAILAKMQKRAGACAGDIQRFCSHVALEKGAIKNCMKANKENISQACKQQIKNKHGKNKKS